MLGQTFLKTVTFIGLWMNGTVFLLRSVRHEVLTSLKLVLLNLQLIVSIITVVSEFIVIFFNFYEVICFYMGSRTLLQIILLAFLLFVNIPLL